MPLRVCICRACSGHGGHRQYYPASQAPGQRCPACQRALDASRPGTAARGYGSDHQAARVRYLSSWYPGKPCPICRRPTSGDPTQLDLAHNEDRTGYLGLAHSRCNRGHHEPSST